jgi:hypothetical protein
VDYSIFKRFLDKFFVWNKEKSKEAGLDGVYIYPIIKVDRWISIRKSEKVVGFIHSNINYYIEPISQQEAKKYEDRPIQIMLYHPHEINAMISHLKGSGGAKSAAQSQQLLPVYIGMTNAITKNLNRSLFDYYLYNIILLHFTNIFNEQRNTKIRNKLIQVIAHTNFDKEVTKLREFVDALDDVEDTNKIKTIIGRFVTIHHDRKQMLEDIRSAYFNFDRIALEQFRGKSRDEIAKKLKSIADTFIKYGKPPTNYQFPNLIVTCMEKTANSAGYCNRGKLIAEKDKIEEILDIIAGQIADHNKWKWLFNGAYINRTMSFFRFIKRKNETIRIELL